MDLSILYSPWFTCYERMAPAALLSSRAGADPRTGRPAPHLPRPAPPPAGCWLLLPGPGCRYAGGLAGSQAAQRGTAAAPLRPGPCALRPAALEWRTAAGGSGRDRRDQRRAPPVSWRPARARLSGGAGALGEGSRATLQARG